MDSECYILASHNFSLSTTNKNAGSGTNQMAKSAKSGSLKPYWLIFPSHVDEWFDQDNRTYHVGLRQHKAGSKVVTVTVTEPCSIFLCLIKTRYFFILTFFSDKKNSNLYFILVDFITAVNRTQKSRTINNTILVLFELSEGHSSAKQPLYFYPKGRALLRTSSWIAVKWGIKPYITLGKE